MVFRIAFPNNNYLPVLVDIANADVSLLIVLDYLDSHQLLADNLKNKLICGEQRWELPLHRRNGHVFLQWNPNEILFMKNELYPMHCKLFHTSATKSFNVLG